MKGLFSLELLSRIFGIEDADWLELDRICFYLRREKMEPDYIMELEEELNLIF